MYTRAASTFAALAGREAVTHGTEVQEAHSLFTLPFFIVLGAALPWNDWAALGWRAAAFPVAVLPLRRIPALFVVAPFLPSVKRSLDAWCAGWFGPIGASAIFYAALAVRSTGREEIWAVTTLVVFSSVPAHGLTAGPFTRRYGQARGNG